jgi:uncharacterized protein YndB with AHSA1/START domain
MMTAVPMLLRMIGTMPTAIVTSDLDAIVAETDVAAPPGRVFEALTDSAALMRWFKGESCPAKFWRMDARMGGTFGYATKGNVAVNGVDEFECHGEILEFDPPRLLVYTWIANWHIERQKATVVRWELTATAGGTHVKVTHSGLASEAASRAEYGGGWPGVLGNLKQFVENQ